MRILFLSNYYPPYALGGYEQWCQEVAGRLVARGHTVAVLTARDPAAPERNGGPEIDPAGVRVYRQLALEVEGGLAETAWRLLGERERLAERNLDRLANLVATERPEAALVWGLWNVPRSLPARLEELLPDRVVYYLCDYWLTLPSAYRQRFEVDARRFLAGWPKRVLGQVLLARWRRDRPAPLRLARPICVSAGLRAILVEAGVPVAHAAVIHGGTDLQGFPEPALERPEPPANPLRLIYLGRLEAEKGVHTAIQALADLVDARAGNPAVELDIVGGGDPDYVATLRRLVQRLGLDGTVHFRGRLPREQIPAMLGQYDALLFPSEWAEPFARTVLEAMAAGLAVIGTTTGGTGEILSDGETGLTFPAGDAAALARQIRRLAADPDLRRRLSTAARQRVRSQFSLTRMVRELEQALAEAACAAPVENVA